MPFMNNVLYLGWKNTTHAPLADMNSQQMTKTMNKGKLINRIEEEAQWQFLRECQVFWIRKWTGGMDLAIKKKIKKCYEYSCKSNLRIKYVFSINSWNKLIWENKK